MCLGWMILANAEMKAHLSDGGDLPNSPLSDELGEIWCWTTRSSTRWPRGGP